MIVTIDDTNVGHECIICAETQTIAIATLTAGTARSKNDIILPACANGHVETVHRTFDHPAEFARAVNALHEALVIATQTYATWAAALAAEVDPDDKPKNRFALSPTPYTAHRGVNGAFAIDVTALYAIHGVDTSAKLLRNKAVILTANEDAEIATFLSNVFPSDPALRDAFSVTLRTNRGLYFP